MSIQNTDTLRSLQNVNRGIHDISYVNISNLKFGKYVLRSMDTIIIKWDKNSKYRFFAEYRK